MFGSYKLITQNKKICRYVDKIMPILTYDNFYKLMIPVEKYMDKKMKNVYKNPHCKLDRIILLHSIERKRFKRK